MIIVSSFTFQLKLSEKKQNFSSFLNNTLYTEYTTYLDKSTRFTINYVNFYLRENIPTELDILITIWLFGK